MRVHFIAIGGSAMHNLAIALHKKGFHVTGSDDEIVEPSFSRLHKQGLLPKQMGWHPELITQDIEVVVLGMHARIDNPELVRAQEMGIRVVSYPQYIYEQSIDKKRVVIGGSHGKTTITAMILHVLDACGKDFDYMVGAQLPGFDTMVKITNAPLIILEGDEYLASPIDRRPKFHLYHAHVALISGIAWDHINVFPTFGAYVEQFSLFLDSMETGGTIVYCEQDEVLSGVINKSSASLVRKGYRVHPNTVKDGVTFLKTDIGEIALSIFGDHNLQNLNGARLICNQIGVSDTEFYNAISTFSGAARRLERIAQTERSVAFKDFAHSPSKLKATSDAVKAQFPDRRLVACMELHTFSSLNPNFLAEYKGAMDKPDVGIVYFDPHTLEHKKLPPITTEQVKECFGRADLTVVNSSQELLKRLGEERWNESNLLLMSSGNFGGLDVNAVAKQLLGV